MNGEFISIANDSKMMNIIHQFKYHDHDIFNCHLKYFQNDVQHLMGNLSDHVTENCGCPSSNVYDLALVIANCNARATTRYEKQARTEMYFQHEDILYAFQIS